MLPVAGVDEDWTLSRLRGLRSDLIDPAIDAHHGRIVKRTGDGSLIEFRSVVDAVRCAIEVTLGAKPSNASMLDGLRPLAPAAVCAARRHGQRRDAGPVPRCVPLRVVQR
jgi:class 3 adenylate cyclase